MTPLRWLYRLLVRGLPGRFRAQHAAELDEVFDFLIAQSRGRGAIGVAALAVLDVAARMPYEHVRRWRRRERGSLMSKSFRFEVKQAIRSVWRQPATSMLVIVMLALGVATNTTVFTLVNALFLRPLPWSESERLVYLNERAPTWNLEYTGINYADFDTWRERVRQFEGIALYSDFSFNLSDGTSVERMEGASITHDYLGVMRLRPVIGRGFTAEEDKPGSPRVALISAALWQTRYARSADVLGRAIRINSEPYTIIGVMPEEAAFPRRAEVWVPLREDPTVSWQSYSYSGIGRLRPGITIAQAEQDLLRAHAPIFEARDTARTVSPRVEPLRGFLVGQFRTLSFALGAGVGIVLLIACANVSSVMLARSTARQREIGIRRALGAGSARIARQLLLENGMLASAGALVGVLWGYWAVRTVLAALPDEVPPWLHFEPDLRVLGFAAALAMFTALVSALGPIIQAIRTSVGFTLASAAATRTSASRGQRRTLNSLVAAEVALACVLLVGGGLLLRAYNQLLQVHPGFRAENVLTFRVALPAVKYPGENDNRIFFQRLIERLQTIPGVQQAGAVSCPPLDCHWGNFVEIEGEPPRRSDQPNPVTLVRLASSGYAKAMGLELLRGRFLEPSGAIGNTVAPRDLVVNETFVNTFMRARDALGRRVRFGGDTAWFTVVGVTRDVKHYGLDRPMRPGLYVSFHHLGDRSSLALIVRTAVEPTSILASVRAAVRDLDPELPLFRVRTMEEALAQSLTTRRMYSWLLAVFAIIALTLAVGGIYGVLAYVVGQRKREIGIRVALGAQRSAVMRLVIRQGIMVAGIGLLLGLAGSLALMRWLGTLLFNVNARDPLTYATVVAVLGTTALVAAWLPARRALRFEPQAVLRE